MDETNYQFDPAKNAKLKDERGVSFEDIICSINAGHLLDIVLHPNQAAYPDQKIMMVALNHYVYQVPFEVRDDEIRLITIFPSRKATQYYLEKRDE